MERIPQLQSAENDDTKRKSNREREKLKDKWIPHTPNQEVVFSGEAAEDDRIKVQRGPCVCDKIFLPEAWIRAMQKLKFHLYQSTLECWTEHQLQFDWRPNHKRPIVFIPSLRIIVHYWHVLKHWTEIFSWRLLKKDILLDKRNKFSFFSPWLKKCNPGHPGWKYPSVPLLKYNFSLLNSIFPLLCSACNDSGPIRSRSALTPHPYRLTSALFDFLRHR